MDVRRNLGTIVALALWLVVIIVSAGAGPSSDTWVGTTNLDVIFISTGAVVALVLLVVLILVGGEGELPAEQSKTPLLSWLLVAAAIALAVSIWDPEQFEELEAIGREGGNLVETLEALADDSEEAPTPTVELQDLLLIAALGGAGMLAFFVWRHRSPDTVPTPDARDAAHAEYSDALRSARSQLDHAVDDRTAVLAAYAELEHVLDRLGHGRRPSDTVQEHRAAVLATFDLDDRPVRALGELYGLARFSERPITHADRERARAALDAALNTLGTS